MCILYLNIILTVIFFIYQLMYRKTNYVRFNCFFIFIKTTRKEVNIIIQKRF